MVKRQTLTTARRISPKALDILTRANVAETDHMDALRTFNELSRSRNRATGDIFAELKAIGEDANVSSQLVKSLLNKYPALFGRLGTMELHKSFYAASGSGAFGRNSNARGAYDPASVSFTK